MRTNPFIIVGTGATLTKDEENQFFTLYQSSIIRALNQVGTWLFRVAACSSVDRVTVGVLLVSAFH